jgi:hypothetical protein
MSDISTALSMNGNTLFTQNELLTCSIFNLKMFLFVLTILICTSCIFMCLTPMSEYNSVKNTCREDFSNNLFFSNKDINYSNYQSAPLTSDNHLLFGQAKRYVHIIESITQPIYILDIYANLFVINGSPFGKSTIPAYQKYIVYLKNTKTSDKLELGNLIRDGDGMYKLHFESKEPNKYISFNEIEITYKTLEKESVLLNGKFTIV